MVEKVSIEIVCENDKKVIRQEFEEDSLLNATRVINTFKPKKGYKVVYVGLQVVEVLV